MPKAHAHWTTLPHGPLERLNDRLWCLEGDLPGMPLKRRSTLARLSDGRLVIHNAIALEQPLISEIEAWGEPAFLLVPGAYHRLDAKSYKQRYPQLRVLCPAGAAAKVAQVVPVDGSYDDLPADPQVQLEHLDGLARREGVMQVHAADGTSLAFNDVLFNQAHLPGLTGLIFRLLRSTGGPRVTAIGRLFLVKEREALGEHLERLAAIPDLKRIIVMHGSSITEDPAGALRQVASRL
jgi:hypothetical protein